MNPSLLGTGRDTDVYALDDKRVLRRFRAGAPSLTEARLMTHVRRLGYPVPEVLEVSGTDMVMERLSGPSMMDSVLNGDVRQGAALADLHDRLHRLAAPDWLPRHRTGGDSIVHMDLHPANVILTPDGPAVIDWTNARAGPAALDVADTLVVLRILTPDGVDPAEVEPRRRQLIDDFVNHVDADPSPFLAEAVDNRLADANLREPEARELRSWRTRLP